MARSLLDIVTKVLNPFHKENTILSEYIPGFSSRRSNDPFRIKEGGRVNGGDAFLGALNHC